MKGKQRFDCAPIKAHFDENGFLVDSPIVARIGLQIYQTPTGERREFRPASEVFKADSLETYAGKPITLGHITVTPENASSVVVGACAGTGVRDGIGVRVPVRVYSDAAIDSARKRRTAEISVGYTSVDVDRAGYGSNETGEFVFIEDMSDPNNPPDGWVKFDALQTEITVNHVALVFRGRAGIAKLNLDSEQETPYDQDVFSTTGGDSMKVKIKLDGAQEFEIDQAVADHIAAIKADAEAEKAKVSALEAERDMLKTKVDGIQDQIDKAVEKAKADAKALAEIAKVAEEAGVKTDGLSAADIKKAFVKAVSGMDVSTKDDAYVDAAFDLARNSDKMAAQRMAINGNGDQGQQKQDEQPLNPASRLGKVSQ